MSLYGTSPIKRTRRTRAEIEALDSAFIEIVEEFSPVTVRQVFYQAVNRSLVPKSKSKGIASCSVGSWPSEHRGRSRTAQS